MRDVKSMRNARIRGKSFESQVAGLIVKAYQDSNYPEFQSVPDDAVKRRILSGAYNERGEKGDLIKIDPIVDKSFPWCIECKNIKSFPSIESLLKGQVNEFLKYWEQTVDQAIIMKEMPMLVWTHPSKHEIYCAMSSFGFEIYHPDHVDESRLFNDLMEGSIILYFFKDFLKNSMVYYYAIHARNYLKRDFAVSLQSLGNYMLFVPNKREIKRK